MPSLRLWLLLAVPLLPASLGAAPPFPGGILDSTGRTAYLATDAGIDAIDLARGEVRWHSSAGHLPLLVAGDRLYALVLSPRNELHICGLDLAGRGERVFLSDVVEFPRWVVTGEATGHSFSCTWRQEKNTLQFRWQAAAWASGASRKEAAGQVRIDLERGRVEVGEPGSDGIGGASSPKPPPSLLPPPAPSSAPLPPQLERLSVRWHRRLAGQLLALTAEEMPDSRPGARSERLLLHSWDERGRPGATRELMRGKQLVVLPGLDNAHVWLRDAAASAPDQVARGEGTAAYWQVYSLIGGHQVARVPFLPGTCAATLIGRRAYCMATAPVRNTFDRPTRRAHLLHAIDLESGKVAWKRPLSSKALPELGD